MPAPSGRLARGITEIVEVLRTNRTNAQSRLEWIPIRGGISADGMHGFTYGYITTTRPDSTRQPGKYLSYWIRRPEGWRVAAYKRLGRAPGDVSLTLREPALPARMVAPANDSTTTSRLVNELKNTERSFSRDAQTMGLGPAFVGYAAPDAMNAGGPADSEFRFGPDSIGAGVAAGLTPDVMVTWEPSDALVATSGDLGVTLGIITITNASAAASPANARRVPYFTVWRRAGPETPWRFVAE
jgi:hypothetical protein